MKRRELSILDVADVLGLDGESFAPWRCALAATFGLPIPDLELFQECTGRTVAPTFRASEAWFTVGRR